MTADQAEMGRRVCALRPEAVRRTKAELNIANKKIERPVIDTEENK